MTIEPKSVVALTYDLYTTENGQETFVEQANEENPLLFLYGVGMMLPKFEENLVGLSSGDSFDFELNASDAYSRNEEDVAELPIEMFGGEVPEIGVILPLQDQDGNHRDGMVTEITEISVTVDLNSPVAGKDLHFKGKILQVRPATEDELSHGHAHGVDGHSGH